MNHGARRTEGDGVNRCWPRSLWLIELVGDAHKDVTQQSATQSMASEVARLDLKRLARELGLRSKRSPVAQIDVATIMNCGSGFTRDLHSLDPSSDSMTSNAKRLGSSRATRRN